MNKEEINCPYCKTNLANDEGLKCSNCNKEIPRCRYCGYVIKFETDKTATEPTKICPNCGTELK